MLLMLIDMTNVQVTGFGAWVSFDSTDNQKYFKNEAPPENFPCRTVMLHLKAHCASGVCRAAESESRPELKSVGVDRLGRSRSRSWSR